MSGRVEPTRKDFLAWILLALGGVYFVLSVLLVPGASTVGQAVQPWPDGAEYLDAAVSLARDGDYNIHVANEKHPPRYPFGFSSAVALVLRLGAPPEVAPYRVNQVAGALLLLFLGWIFWRRGRYREAGLAVLLLATLPAFVILARSPLSEVTSTLLMLIAIWALYVFAGAAAEGRAWKWGVTGAFLLGLGLCFRSSSVFLIAFIPAAVFARHGLRFSAWSTIVREGLILGFFFTVGTVPAFGYQLATFGDPLATGYEYWVPFWSASRAFSGEFLEPNALYYWQEFSQSETEFTTATTYGHGQGSYLSPSFVLLTLLSFLALWRQKRLRWFLLAGLAYQFVMIFYFFKDARLAFPILTLAVPFIALGLVKIWQQGHWISRLFAVLFFGATVLGWPSPEGGMDSIALVRSADQKQPLSAHEVVQRFKRVDDPTPSLVLTDMVPPYVHAVLPEGTVVAPLDHDHFYRHHPEVFLYKGQQRAELVATALAEKRSVWVITNSRDIFAISESYTAPEGYGWEMVSQLSPTSGIARLVTLDDRSVRDVPLAHQNQRAKGE